MQWSQLAYDSYVPPWLFARNWHGKKSSVESGCGHCLPCRPMHNSEPTTNSVYISTSHLTTQLYEPLIRWTVSRQEMITWRQVRLQWLFDISVWRTSVLRGQLSFVNVFSNALVDGRSKTHVIRYPNTFLHCRAKKLHPFISVLTLSNHTIYR